MFEAAPHKPTETRAGGHLRLLLCLLGLAFLAALLAPALVAAKPAYVGFQVHALWYERSTSEMQRELDLIQETGGNAVRVDIGWSSLESDGKGQLTGWYLEKLDRFVNEAASRQLKVVATVHETPCWASSAPESLKQGCSGAWWGRGVQTYPPNRASDYADAVRFVTARYGDRLAALEVWNEPNLERFLNAPNRAAAYAELVKAAYPAAKQGNASVPVLAGSLAAADRPFLEELFALGIKGSYDGISAHPYNEWRDPYDRWLTQWRKYTFLPGIEWLHEAQAAIGDSTPLWITEFGWDTCSGASWCVDEAKQADYTVKALQILETMPYVAGATAYELRDGSTDKSDFEGNWGLVRKDFSPKPALDAVRQQLHGEATPAPVTVDVNVGDSGTVVVEGSAGTERQLIEAKLPGCKAAAGTSRYAMTSKKGRYRFRLGSIARFKGCKVKVQPQRSTRAVSKRVPKRVALAEFQGIALAAASRAGA